jgi:hypothetical protein
MMIPPIPYFQSGIIPTTHARPIHDIATNETNAAVTCSAREDEGEGDCGNCAGDEFDGVPVGTTGVFDIHSYVPAKDESICPALYRWASFAVRLAPGVLAAARSAALASV